MVQGPTTPISPSKTRSKTYRMLTSKKPDVVSLNYIKQLGLKDALWKREQLAQMTLPLIVTLMPAGNTIKGEGFYVNLFLIRPLHME